MKEFYLFLFVAVCFFNVTSFNYLKVGVLGIGVNYGLLGDNLPPPRQVIGLLQSRNISKIRIFDPNSDVMTALGGSGIEAVVGVRNEDLQKLAAEPSYATQWVNDHVVPYLSSFTTFTYIAAGNEVIPGPLAGSVLNAIRNLEAALKAVVPLNNIRVTTAVSTQVLGESFPPSSGVFSEEAGSFMVPIAAYLSQRATPLLVNVYPFFAYVNNRGSIPLDYALLRETETVSVKDKGLEYRNMFDAIVDSVYSALEKVSASGVEVVVSETGWPSSGDPDATIANAQTYVNNVVALESSGRGTPKRPGKPVQTYIFALFNEDLKAAGVEQNFGLYHPDMTEVYHVNFPA